MHELLHRPFDVRSFAMSGLFLLAIFYTIYFLRSLLLPFVLALLLSYLLRPVVRVLAKVKIPPLIGAALLLLSLVGRSATAFRSSPRRPRAGSKKRLTACTNWSKNCSRLKNRWRRSPRPAARSKTWPRRTTLNKTPTVEVKQHPLTDRLMGQTPELLVSTLTMLILLYFLLAYDGVFLGKLIKLMPTLSDKKRAVSIAQRNRSPGFPLSCLRSR